MKYTLSYPKFDVDYDSFTLKNIDSEISIEGVEQATSSIGLIHPRNLKEKDKELFTRIARFFDYPIMEFEGRTAKEAKEKIKKFRKDSSLTDLIIIGDELAFPSFRYRTKHSISYTDNYYEDIDSNGQFNLRVGRIFQSPQLLLNHISKGFSRDEGPVVIFDANPEQDNEIVHLLKSENYSIEEYANIGETKKEHLVNSLRNGETSTTYLVILLVFSRK